MNGQRHTRWMLLFLAFSGLVNTNVSVAAEQDTSRLVVVVATVKGAPPLKPQVAKLVEAPLASKAVLIPYATYLKAAKGAGLKPAAAETSNGISLVGKRVGATRVLLLKPVVEPGGDSDAPAPSKKGKGKGKGAKAKKAKKGNKNFALEAALYDVATGQILLSSTYPLENGKKLAQEVAQQIVREVTPKLSPPVNSSDVAIASPVPEPAPLPVTPPPAPLPVAQPVTPQDTELRQAPAPPMEPYSPFAPATQPPTESVVTDAAPPPPASIEDRTPSKRSGLGLHFGWLAWHRDAEITAKPGEKPPLYSTLRDGDDRDKFQYGFPGLSRLAGQLELYPFSFGGKGNFHEGIGLYADGSLGMIRSRTEATNVEITSLVHDIRAGAVYRLVLWNAPTAIEGQLRLGVNSYSFPLKQAAFPSFSYVGPMLGARLAIPLGVAWLQLLLGADMSRFGAIGTSTTTFLGAVNGMTSADTFHGGLRGVIAFTEQFALDLSLLAQFQTYSAAFRGRTQLQDITQFDNVKYAEQNLGAMFLAGIAL